MRRESRARTPRRSRSTGIQPRRVLPSEGSTSSPGRADVWEEVEETFRASVVRLVGEQARTWLDGLPTLEAEMCERWQLDPGPELRGGLLALVRIARRADGSEAVLK